MRDPAYLIFGAILVIALLDYFLLNSYFISFFGKYVTNASNWVADFMPG